VKRADGQGGSGAATAREVGRALRSAEPLNAVLHWSQELLDAEGARVDAMPSPGTLAGMPIAVKDNIVTVEQPTTCASRILEGYVSPYTATAVNRLRDAGAIVAAKTNLDEFAMGSSTEHSARGRVKHPLDPDRVPGGSSGGSAALVAAGVVPAALGSETGGSVRQPASFCGVVGVKPSYGRVSRYGLVAFGSSLDAISVFGRTVDHASRVLAAMSGPDPLDATTVDRPPMRAPEPLPDLRGLRIGLPREYFPDDLHPGVAAALARVKDRIRELGAELRECRCPTRSTRCRPITSSRRPRRRQTWPGTMGCGTVPARSAPRAISGRCTGPRGEKGSGPRCAGGSWWAPTCSAPATTMPTTPRRSRPGR
jgi:aspartyl-tRNA(Asn)/glutamyl-tRNA(Gln) amidotransferase subunit A